MDKVYKNPLTGEDLAPEKVVEIIKTYGSYDAWVQKLKKNPVTREMVNTDPKANGGNVVAREKMKEQAQGRAGLGAKVADVALDALHYVPQTRLVADIMDKPDGPESQAVNTMAIGSGMAPTIDPAASGSIILGKAAKLSNAMKSESGILGAIDDVKETAKLYRDIIKTPNKDYEPKYESSSKWGDYLK